MGAMIRTSPVHRRRHDRPRAQEWGHVRFTNAEIVWQQMPRGLGHPIGQAVLTIGPAVENADHLGILGADFLDRVAAVARDIGALSGPLFGFNDTWQLVINTSTTIITFLMVFIIQNGQNRDTAAMQITFDELLSKVEVAREELINLEELDQEDLAGLKKIFEKRAKVARDGGDPDKKQI